jgi:hypothetical protein
MLCPTNTACSHQLLPLILFFFDNFKLNGEGFNDIFKGPQTQPVTIDFAKDLVIEHRKVYASSVSKSPISAI